MLGRIELFDKDQNDYVAHYVDLKENTKAAIEKDIGKISTNNQKLSLRSGDQLNISMHLV